MIDHGKKTFFDLAFQIGTPECAVFSAAVAMVVGLLILCVGFWNTVFIFLLMALGAFLGGVKNKKEWLKDIINRLFPAKSAVTYRGQHAELTKAVRRATRKQPEEEPEEEPEEDYTEHEEEQ